FLDGARLFNAAVATSSTPATLAAPFDLAWVALSKGLGAPSGSVLAGSQATIDRALRHRRMLGGAMRQAGFLAAAGLYALDHNVDRLADDHANARQMGARLAASDAIELDLATVQTNIVVFHLPPGSPDAATVVERAREQGVGVMAFADRTVRAVTHLDVSPEQCDHAGAVLVTAAEQTD
ncbi:MAG TPA: beta-eliminating lyase-related protein, partial [Nitriliruptoraceae bacterium]|nr:beta-eliminating lyase-related protein [Nitriliruptoraceae bacterium]